jgi:hypothetical protein
MQSPLSEIVRGARERLVLQPTKGFFYSWLVSAHLFCVRSFGLVNQALRLNLTVFVKFLLVLRSNKKLSMNGRLFAATNTNKLRLQNHLNAARLRIVTCAYVQILVFSFQPSLG